MLGKGSVEKLTIFFKRAKIFYKYRIKVKRFMIPKTICNISIEEDYYE